MKNFKKRRLSPGGGEGGDFVESWSVHQSQNYQRNLCNKCDVTAFCAFLQYTKAISDERRNDEILISVKKLAKTAIKLIKVTDTAVAKWLFL